jgi:hypothetical protein
MHYFIPNFCINDPFFEKQIKEDNSLNIKDKILKVVIKFYFYANLF